MTLLTRAWTRWERFAFVPVDARMIATLRISLGLLVLISWVQWWPVIEDGASLISLTTVAKHHTSYRISHFDLLEGFNLHLAHFAGLVAIVAWTVGLGSRVANLMVAALLIGLWHRFPWMHNGGDRLLRLWVLYLCLAPTGAAWSVDAWIARRRGREAATHVQGLAVRLIQLQIMVVYTGTGIEKLAGAAWLDGTAITWALSDGSFNRMPSLLDPLARSTWGQLAGKALTWGTLAWEIAFAPLMLVRRARVPTLLAGVALHLGIGLTMSVGMFGPASVWAYQAFFRDRWGRDRSSRPRSNDDAHVPAQTATVSVSRSP